MGKREAREREFYNEFAAARPAARSLLDRFSDAFYEKGRRGRLWTPFWKTTDVKGATVLDYGCGTGEFSLVLAGRGARVFGIDISSELLAQARSTAARVCNGDSPKFVTGDAHHTPFHDGMFDFVVGNGALHHLDLDKAFQEVARVLKPGGLAVFMEPMYSHPLLWMLRRLTPSSHTPDERPLTLADIERARQWFPSCRHHEHFLFAVGAAPAHLLGKKFALSVIKIADMFDGLLMRFIPGLRGFAWITMVEMGK
jgi:SAM-dependent methyltransferase